MKRLYKILSAVLFIALLVSCTDTNPVAVQSSDADQTVIALKERKKAPPDRKLEDPRKKDECKNGGWEDFGIRNQGQCIRFVNTGQDSR